MLKLIVFIITMALAGPAVAGEWQLVGRDRDGMLALRVDAIDRGSENPHAWTLIVHPWPLGDGTDYTVNYVEFDCRTRDRFRFVTVRAFHRGRVANGLFDNFEWEDAYPGTWAEDALRLVCRQGRVNQRSILPEGDEHDIARSYIDRARAGDFR